MYKWDEMTPRERDALVAEKVMKKIVPEHEWMRTTVSIDKQGFHHIQHLPSYSTDISAAWEIFQNIKERMFSKRQKFMKEIQLLISCNADLPIGHVIAWPEAFWWITPELICRAALEAVGIEIE